MIPNRPRSIRLMSHHIFRIGEAFLESASRRQGIRHRPRQQAAGGRHLHDRRPRSRATARKSSGGCSKWWDQVPDKTLGNEIKTYYGMQPMHMVFERSTWHSAQHARQLIHVLERFGIEPNVRLTPEDLAGLPLPERLFE